MDKNILDRATDKLLDTLVRVDTNAKNDAYYPYGTVKATAEEKRAQFESLDIAGLTKMMEERGRDETNKYLKHFMGGANNGMVR